MRSSLVVTLVVLLLACCLCSVQAASVGDVTPAPFGRRARALETIEWRAPTAENKNNDDASDVVNDDALVLHAYTTGAAGTALSQLAPFKPAATVRSLMRSNLVADLLLDRGLGAASQCQCEMRMMLKRSSSSSSASTHASKVLRVADPSEVLRDVLLESAQPSHVAELRCLSKNGRSASWSFVQFARDPSRKLDPAKVTSALKATMDASGALAPYPLTSAELLAETWEGVNGWVTAFLENHWGDMHPYPSYAETVYPPGQALTGRWHLNTGEVLQRGASFDRQADGEQVRLAVAADWGAGTLESDCVQSAMMSSNGTDFDPHWTLHVGDVYYVGSTAEVQSNCLGQAPAGVAKGVTWPHGSLGSLAVQGNHEAYSRCYGFFDTFLPTLGARTANGTLSGQTSGYASLENAYWRVIMLDTGYNTCSLEPKIDNTNNTQPQAILDWLVREVNIGNASDTRGIIFFTHHQVITAFGGASLATPEQIVQLLPPNSTVLWLWGHEHRVAWYNPFELQGTGGHSMNIHGRCVGSSGFPATAASLPAKAAASGLIAYDDRICMINTGFFDVDVTFNGFTRLVFESSSN